MSWQQWLFVVMMFAMAISLYGFLAYMYSSKQRGERIENGKNILFTDEPLEPRT